MLDTACDRKGGSGLVPQQRHLVVAVDHFLCPQVIERADSEQGAIGNSHRDEEESVVIAQPSMLPSSHTMTISY